MSSPADVDGLHPDDRVALLLPGSEEYVDVVIGLLAAGIFPVPLDPRLTAAEREQVLGDVEPRLVVHTAEDFESLAAWVSKNPTDGPVPLGRPMHVTSGTTGRPKAVDSGMLTQAQAEALIAEERDLWGFRSNDVNLVLSPIYHSAPLRFAMGTRLAGGRVVFGLDKLDQRMERGQPTGFDPATITAAIEHKRPTTMFCVPTHLQRLFRHWDEAGVPDLSGFRLVAHAGAPCPSAVKRQLIELFPAGSTWEFYGSSEGQFTACRSEEWLERPGTVGRARPGRKLRLDDDGTIWCAVPDHARFRYFGDPEKTDAAWREGPDGPEFTVRDVGRMNDDGYLYLDGRREDLIISGGVNVYPLEVENALREHPAVEDVAVFGVPDDEWGQRVCAAVVGSADETELTSYARDRLAPPKRPKTWRFTDELPRTPTGKVRRDRLV